ncbi:LamB/YcsF family protein [Streptomyces tubercidicus]|uniref:LamB/YcsF family protein n=1 Tax=Streptomyces tubercidicus TaxID=47759 RepID=UPI003465227D
MSTTPRIDINCDIGESYGRWSLGDDRAMMPYVSSVNIATGYHAGDPPTMRKTVESAVEHGLGIGAHIAFPDLMGFGRRRMVIAPHDLQDYCLYQLGALQAFVTAAGGRLAHVKPHGALYVMASDDPEAAYAIAAATAAVDASLPLMLLHRGCADAVARAGITLVSEAFPDLHYDDQGKLMIENSKVPWAPEVVASRAVRMAVEGRVASVEGLDIEVDAQSLCIHGDASNAVDVAQAVHAALGRAGVDIVPLGSLLAACPTIAEAPKKGRSCV